MIIIEKLEYQKLHAKWILKMFTNKHKGKWMCTGRVLLYRYRQENRTSLSKLRTLFEKLWPNLLRREDSSGWSCGTLIKLQRAFRNRQHGNSPARKSPTLHLALVINGLGTTRNSSSIALWVNFLGSNYCAKKWKNWYSNTKVIFSQKSGSSWKLVKFSILKAIGKTSIWWHS